MSSAMLIDKEKLGSEFKKVYPGRKWGIEALALVWLVHKITIPCLGHSVCVTVCVLRHRSSVVI